MYFKISRNILLNLLSIASKAVSSSSPLPSLLGLKITVTDNTIELMSSDSDISIKTVWKKEKDHTFEVYEPGSIVINKNYINDIVRKIDSDDIEFEILDGSLTKISGGTSEFKINGIKSNEYPLIDFNKPDKEFSISASLLKKIVAQTSFAASTQETRPALTGINFCCDGHTLECVATDSYRLAKKKVSLPIDLSFNITIPAKSLNEVSKIVDGKEEVVVAISDKKAQFICGNTIVQTRLIDGAYPNTSRLIPTVFDYEMVMNMRDLISAIDRQSFIKNETDQFSVLKLSMSPNEIVISSRSQEVGSSMETLHFDSYQGNELNISFSGKYVYDALRELEGKTVKISFCGEMKPFVITSPDDASVLQLVLPIRTYN